MPDLIDPKLRGKLPYWAEQSPQKLSPLAKKAYDAVMATPPDRCPCPHDFLLTHGNHLESIKVDGPEIYREFITQLSQALYTVDIAFFKWDPDSQAAFMIGEGLKEATKAIKGRPLIVRIIVNDWRLDLSRPINDLYDSVKNWGIPVIALDDLLHLPPPSVNVVFQLATYPFNTVGILHEKLIVIDSCKVLLTGANPEVQHNLPKPWRDTGYVLSGSVALCASASFDDAWHRHAKHWECKKRSLTWDCKETRHRDAPRRWLKDINFQEKDTNMMLVGSSSRPLVGTPDTPQTAAWESLMSNAAQEIRVISPNIDSEPFVASIVKAVQRGTKVRLLTSKGFNDKWPDKILRPNAAVLVDIRQKLAALPLAVQKNFETRWYSRDGNTPVEGNGDWASHTKFFSVDGQVAVVGSGNMDFMSWANAREFNVLIDNVPAVQRLDSMIFLPDWGKGVNV